MLMPEMMYAVSGGAFKYPMASNKIAASTITKRMMIPVPICFPPVSLLCSVDASHYGPFPEKTPEIIRRMSFFRLQSIAFARNQAASVTA